MTNATGSAIEEESDFYPYGGEILTTDTLPDQNYKFTGKERDADGLDYFFARHYSSRLGRFMTPDWSAVPVPVPYAVLTNPQTLNLYSYVENNPITGTDPDGHYNSGEGFFGLNSVIQPQSAQGGGGPYDSAIFGENFSVYPQTYPVSGNTAEEAWQDASKKTPNPEGYPGNTAPAFVLARTITIRAEGNDTNGWTATAQYVDVQVTVKATVTTPTWVNKSQASPAEQKKWNAQAAKLQKHELGHVAIVAKAAKQLQTTIRGLTATASGPTSKEAAGRASAKLNGQLNRAIARAVAEASAKGAEYDIRTHHGVD